MKKILKITLIPAMAGLLFIANASAQTTIDIIGGSDAFFTGSDYSGWDLTGSQWRDDGGNDRLVFDSTNAFTGSQSASSLASSAIYNHDTYLTGIDFAGMDPFLATFNPQDGDLGTLQFTLTINTSSGNYTASSATLTDGAFLDNIPGTVLGVWDTVSWDTDPFSTGNNVISTSSITSVIYSANIDIATANTSADQTVFVSLDNMVVAGVFSPVPEPATCATIAGLLALCFVAVRRRLSAK